MFRRLVVAGTEGRIDPAELAARAQAAQQATTMADLGQVTADLPGHGAVAAPGRRPRSRRFILGFLGVSGPGPGRALRARVTAAAVLGEVVIDLRQTAVTSFETEITVLAVLGEVRIIVPAGFALDAASRATVLGRTLSAGGSPGAGPLVPVIKLNALAVLGNVLVQGPRDGA